MSWCPPDIAIEEIYAFIDGELEGPRRDEIARRIATDPALARAVAARRRDGETLAAALTRATEGPMPERLRHILDQASLPPRPQPTATPGFWARNRTSLPLAGIAAAVLLGLPLLLLMPRAGNDLALGDGGISHALALHEGHATASEMALAGDPGLNALLARAGLRETPRPPDLTRFGYRLAAATRQGQEIALRYAGQDGKPLTIVLRNSDGSVRFDILSREGLRVCLWQDDVISATIVGDMPAGTMMRLASAAYGALNL